MSGTLLIRLRSLPLGMRFLLAGGGAAGTSWLVRFPLSLLMPFTAAVLVAAVIGMAIGFVAYRDFVFPGSDRPMTRQLADFLLVNATTSLAVAAAASLAAAVLMRAVSTGTAEAVAHAIGIAMGAVLNFVGHRALTFRRPEGRPRMREPGPELG